MFFDYLSYSGLTSEEKILKLFRKNNVRKLTKILEVCPASYRRAITMLRKQGYKFECKKDYVKVGKQVETHTTYTFTDIENVK